MKDSTLAISRPIPPSILKLRGLSIAILAIVSSLAFMHSDTTLISTSVVRTLMPIPNYLATLVLIYTIFRSPKTLEFNIPLLLCVIFYWLFTTFNVYGGGIIFHPLTIVILVSFSIMGPRVWTLSFRYFRYYLIITSVLGIIAYFSFVLSLGLPFQIVDYYGGNGSDNWYYAFYYFSILSVRFDGIRLCGLFNEPGYFGTFLALYLIAGKCNFKRIDNIIMLIAGFLTFSFAFFLLIIMYYIFKLFKKPQKIFIALIIICALVYVLPIIAKHNEMIAYFFERFSIEDGHFSGDNRTNDFFLPYWEKFINGGPLLFGYGLGYLNEIESGALSYKCVIIEHGYIGAALFWGTLFLSVSKNLRTPAFIFIILFFVSIYQRPNVIAIYYLLLLMGGIIESKVPDNERINKQSSE